MCFFVFAKDVGITIEYASESITLFENGKSEVIADLLLRNDSLDDDVDILYILYPNRFFSINNNKVAPVEIIGGFDDHSHTIKDFNSQLNWAYKDPSNPIAFINTPVAKPLDVLAQDVALEHLTLKQPHPLDPVETLSYSGFIGGEITLSALSDLTMLQWVILQELNYTVLSADFSPSIKAGQSRWVRWRFEGEKAAGNFINRNTTFLKLTNQLHYDYQIRGMYDVKNQFMELLYVLKEKVNSQYNLGQDLLDDINELVQFFVDCRLTYPKRDQKQLPVTTVRIPDWRVHISPGKLVRLTDIIMRGDVAIIGGMPNYIGYEDKIIPVYEWKAGSDVTKKIKPDFEYSFSIFFQTKQFSWLGANFIWAIVSVLFFIATIVTIVIYR